MNSSYIPQVNLIPDEQLISRHKSLWITRWCVITLCVIGLIAIPAAYIGASATLSDSGMAEQIEKTQLEYASHQGAIPDLKKQLAGLIAEQEVLDLVHNRIEWRDVISVLVDSSRNDVRFRRMLAVGGGVEGTGSIEISLEGLAASQTVARAYVVNLEQAFVFDSVELVETKRERVGEYELVRFKLLIRVENGEVSDAG